MRGGAPILEVEPSEPEPHDWEADPRPFAECLRDWERRLNGGRVTGARAAAATALRVPIATYNGWRAGRPAANEATLRRLMQLTPV